MVPSGGRLLLLLLLCLALFGASSSTANGAPEACRPLQAMGRELPWRVPLVEDGSRPVRVYILDSIAAVHSAVRITWDMVERFGATPEHLPWNELKGQVDQFSHELYAFQRMYRYPHLTTNPEEADLVYLPWLFCVEALMSWNVEGKIWKGPQARTLQRALREDPVFQQHISKVFLSLDGWPGQTFHYKVDRDLFAKVIIEALQAGAFLKPAHGLEYFVSIPVHVNHALVEGHSCARQLNDDRPRTIYFEGARRTDYGGLLRERLHQLPWSRIPNAEFTLTDAMVEKLGNESLQQLAFEYAQKMYASRYCIIVGGTRAARRPRLALAAPAASSPVSPLFLLPASLAGVVSSWAAGRG